MSGSKSSKTGKDKTKVDRFELIESIDEMRFKVTDKSDVLNILQRLKEKSAFLTVYADDDNRSFLTVIFVIDGEKRQLILDAPGDAIFSRHVLQAEKVTLSTSVDRVRIQFELFDLTETEYEGHRAYVASFPMEITRLQRRDFYRLTVPIITPIQCELVVDDVVWNSIKRYGAYDISLGGIGINNLPSMPAGERLNNVTVLIPDDESFNTDLVVCHKFSIRLRNGENLLRTGCRYAAPSSERDEMIQRYINRVTMERKLGDNVTVESISQHNYEDPGAISSRR